MAADRCLVEFFALELKRAGGALKVSQDTLRRYERSMPTMLAEFMNSKYNRSLTQFFRYHKDSFGFCENLVGLLPQFEARSILAQPENLTVVQFFLDLLQKIGASREQPCSVHVLSKYVPYMDHDARLFLHKMYANSLNVFFTLNSLHFHMTAPDRGLISLRQPLAASNCVAVHLRKCLHKNNAFDFSSGLNTEELLHQATATWLPELRLYFGDGSRASKLNSVLNSYPNVFKWKPHGKIWLRRRYEKWDRNWNSAEELLAAIHFMELLKDIGATPSNPICFNYILCSAESVPKECSAYINHVFPGIDLIDLFHLHPDKFDLSTTNCVSLKCGDRAIEMKKSPDALSAYYAAQLLKYAPNLMPDTLKICTENAPKAVKSYCGSTVRHRLHTVLDAGRELLTNGIVDNMMAADLLRSIYSYPVSGSDKRSKISKECTVSTVTNPSTPKKASAKPSKKSKQTSSLVQPQLDASNLKTESAAPHPTAEGLTVAEKEKPHSTIAKTLSLTEMKQDAVTPDSLKRFQSHVSPTTFNAPPPNARSVSESEETKLQNTVAKSLGLTEVKQDAAALDTSKRSQSHLGTTVLTIPTPATESLAKSKGSKLQNTRAKALSLTEMSWNAPALDTPKRSQSFAGITTLITSTATARKVTEFAALKPQNALLKTLSVTELKQDTAALGTLKRLQSKTDETTLIFPTLTSRTMTESEELKPWDTLVKAISLSDFMRDTAVSDTQKRSQSHVRTSMIILQTSSAERLTDSQLEPRSTMAKALSLTELEQNISLYDELKRYHSLPFASYSTSLPSHLVPAVSDDVTRIKMQDGKSEIPTKTSSSPCLIANESRGLAPSTEKSSSCVELRGVEPRLLAKTVTHRSLAGQRQQPKLCRGMFAKVGEETKAAETNQVNACGGASNYTYSKMEHVVLEFIKKRLAASPTHLEDMNSLSDAVNKNFGVLPKYEIHLALLCSEGTLSFDGKHVLYNAN